MPLAYGLDLRPIPLEVHARSVYSPFVPPCIIAPLALYVCGVAVGEPCSKGLCLVLHGKKGCRGLVRQVGRSCLKRVFALVGDCVQVAPVILFAFFDKARLYD